MRRREFITFVGGALAASSLPARAQQGPTPIIGFLNPTSPKLYQFNAAAFRDGLQQAGYVEGQNIRIEYRWADNDYSRLRPLAEELVALKVDAIAATGDVASARAVQAATTSIPIVFTIGADPVRFGLVASYNRPGGNITGISAITSTIASKRIQVLGQLAKWSKVGLLMNPDNFSAESEQKDAQGAVRSLGKESVVLNVRTASDIEAAFRTFVSEKADALFVGTDPVLLSRRDEIATFAAAQRIPAIHFDRQYPVGGGLISYGTSVSGMYRQAGVYIGQILKGAKPAEMPVLQPTKFELVLNLKAARALGLEVPAAVLALADEVTE